MNFFVAGGTGYLGRPLIEQLLARGHTVRAVARAESVSKLPAACEAIIADPLKTGSYSAAGCDTFIHLIGVSHPSPSKAQQFRDIDLRSVEVAVPIARAAGAQHFIYVSVAHPAPAMHAYTAARAEAELIIRTSGLNATFIRPWYVLGPGHRWPVMLKPLYWLFGQLPSTRATAQRLGLVTHAEMLATLLHAAEGPATRIRIIEVPEIRRAHS